MKNQIYFILLLSLALLSCNKEELSTTKLDGKWDLVNVTCFCPVLPVFQKDHIWDFDTENLQLKISNDGNEEMQVLDNGNYTIDVTNNVLTIESVNYTFDFKDGSLFLDSGSQLDGSILKFVR